MENPISKAKFSGLARNLLLLSLSLWFDLAA
jgi:hypothetical protein